MTVIRLNTKYTETSFSVLFNFAILKGHLWLEERYVYNILSLDEPVKEKKC